MKFSVSSTLYYHAFEPGTIICSISCLQSGSQKTLDETLTISRDVERTDMHVGLDAARLTKIYIPTPGDLSVQYQATVEASVHLVDLSKVNQAKSLAFQAVALPYLTPSRYVPSDRMRVLAFDLFGRIEGTMAQALAIEKWLYENISYRIGSSSEQSWSLDTFEIRAGVCRDFAHLGIAFCRALNIPARYVTVYAYLLNPQDFHAVFEVFIDGIWYLMDGTRLAPLNGMVRIATGRDASETAVGSLFGNIQGQGIYVWSQIAMGEQEIFSPTTRETLRENGKVLYLG